MIPRIPEGCERFRFIKDEWHFLTEVGIWIPVADLFGIAGTDLDPSGAAKRTVQDFCNAARCAWLDEAERIWLAQPRPVIAMYRYWDGLTYWESGILDPVRLQYLEWPAWEIDHAHCLAWAEAWAREAKGEWTESEIRWMPELVGGEWIKEDEE